MPEDLNAPEYRYGQSKVPSDDYLIGLGKTEMSYSYRGIIERYHDEVNRDLGYARDWVLRNEAKLEALDEIIRRLKEGDPNATTGTTTAPPLDRAADTGKCEPLSAVGGEATGEPF